MLTNCVSGPVLAVNLPSYSSSFLEESDPWTNKNQTVGSVLQLMERQLLANTCKQPQPLSIGGSSELKIEGETVVARLGEGQGAFRQRAACANHGKWKNQVLGLDFMTDVRNLEQHRCWIQRLG